MTRFTNETGKFVVSPC